MNDEEKRDQQIAVGAVVVVGVVGYLVLRRRVRVRTAQAVLEASERAVEAWVGQMERNGLNVIVLPTGLTQKLVEEKVLTS